jgi:serine/threonine-protein kinase RsbW
MAARHRDPTRQYLVDRLRSNYPPQLFGPHPAAEVSRIGSTRWAASMSDEFLRLTTLDDSHYEITKALGFHSYLTVPLKSDDAVLGSVTFVSSGRSFGSRDVSFAERLAQQVAAVVDNARQSDAALQTSHILQESLLPQHLPDIPGLRIETRYLAATRGLEVGGDFYDVILLPNQKVGISIGDVAGHDRHAAALMGQFRSAFRALGGHVGSPAELIVALRRSWELLDVDRITTAVFAQLDPGNGDLVMASAGHYPPLVVGPGGFQFLPVVPSTPLGAPASPVSQWSGTLGPGQVLLMYTDGAIDERYAGSTASMERLADVASDGVLDPASVCQRLVDLLDADRIDDVALLAVALDRAD